MSKTPAGGRVVRAHNLVAYGLTDMLGSGAMMVIGGWILFFYTSFCGLSVVQAASIFAIARFVDALGSTFIGHVSDRIGQTWVGRKFGRRRVFLLASLPLLPLFALMWVSGQAYLYYLCTYIAFEVVYASVLIPFETLAAEMSDDYRIRAKFAGARIMTGQVAAVIASALPNWIVGNKAAATAQTFLIMGVIFSIIFVVSIFLTWLFTWERERTVAAAAEAEPDPKSRAAFSPVQLVRNIWMALRIRAFRLHLGMYLGGYTSIDVLNAVFTYYIVFTLGGTVGKAATLLGVMSAAQFFSVWAFITLAVRMHPGPAYRLAAATYAVGAIALGALAVFRVPNGLALAYPIAFLAGLGRGGLIYIPWNTYNYIADVDEIVSTERREGVFAGVMTMVRKAVQALSVMAVGAILQMGGFLSGAASQPSSAKTMIVAVLIAGPLLFLLFGTLVSRRFTLSQPTHALLMREIARFRNGDRAPPTGEDEAAIRALTGQPTSRLWGGALNR